MALSLGSPGKQDNQSAREAKQGQCLLESLQKMSQMLNVVVGNTQNSSKQKTEVLIQAPRHLALI